MDFKYYYKNDQEILDDLTTSKEKLLRTKTSGEIQQLLSEIKIVLDYLDNYLLKQEFIKNLLSEVLSDSQLFSKKGTQKIFSELWISFTEEQKEHLTQLILKHYHQYEHGAFCWTICNFIYQDLNDYNPVSTRQVYEQLMKQGMSIVEFGDVLYFNCGIDIDFVGPTK